MIPLSTRGTPVNVSVPIVCKVFRDVTAEPHWSRRASLSDGLPPERLTDGIAAAICTAPVPAEVLARLSVPLIHGVPIAHLHDGDVVSIQPSGVIRTVYRRGSPHNTLFATERCNSFCVMCSQPPREVDDAWRVAEMLQTIELMDDDVAEVGISGGEPTLLGEGLLDVLRACRDRLPNTAVHVLSNGRTFRYDTFARSVAEIAVRDVMFGIPLYSDLDHEHDYVVQARGAFEDTVLGLQNLARHEVPVEIRVVVHRFTYQRLPDLAEFIYRNLTFARHVALMGLEATGFAKGNMEALWVDPADYRHQLESATVFLATRGMNVSVYNHQLCTVPESIWPYCRRSISDWKNEYLPVCDRCDVKPQCGGFFSFNLSSRLSKHIAPIILKPPVN